MKLKLLAAATLIALSTSAQATDVNLAFDDKSQQVAFQLPGLLDQCVAGITLRGDATACKAISNSLAALSSMVSQAQKAAADAKTAADKAAEEAKRAEKPAEPPTP